MKKFVFTTLYALCLQPTPLDLIEVDVGIGGRIVDGVGVGVKVEVEVELELELVVVQLLVHVGLLLVAVREPSTSETLETPFSCSSTCSCAHIFHHQNDDSIKPAHSSTPTIIGP